MLVTQTCDLQAEKTRAGRPLALVAPVVKLTETRLRDALRDTRPNLIPIPWVGPDQFGDLDQIAAIDRALVASAPLIASPADSDRRGLAYRVGRYFSRAALPDDVVRALGPLSRAVDPKHKSLQRVYAAVDQIRVSSDPDYGSGPPYVLDVTLLVQEDWLPDAEPEPYKPTANEPHKIAEAMVEVFEAIEKGSAGQLVTLWCRLAEQLQDRLSNDLKARSRESVAAVNVGLATALTPRQYDESDVLDFGHLSLATDA
jgi:hypothetical protein